MDEFGWSRERGPPGRPMSPPLRGRRGRPPFHEDERGRPISPPPWPPNEHYRRGRSPPGPDFRGRPPPPEEFDRFGHLLPPPPREADFFDERGRPPLRDWDRRDCKYFSVCQSELYPGVIVYLILEIFDTFLYIYSATTFLGQP